MCDKLQQTSMRQTLTEGCILMSIKRKDMVEPTTWVSHRLTLFLYYLPKDPSVSKPATHQKLPGRKKTLVV